MGINKLLKGVVVSICTATIFTGCGNKVEMEIVKEKESSIDGKQIELNLWSHYGGMENVISSFEKENPNVKVNLKVFEHIEYEKEYKKSLMLENGEADLFIIDSNDYGNFNSINGLENLLKTEYNARSYEKDFDKELWELGKSLDKRELLGIPIASAPIVTYYRKDIMEKYGFPGEPEELAEFMKDKENWFEIGKTLKKDGISIVQWYAELVRISSSNMPYFNENLEYQRNDKDFEEAIDIAIKAQEFGLGAHADIWMEAGMKALKEDKLAMLYLGSWGSNDLANMVPEQKGKWRVTSLPFGLYGWNNASIMAMAGNSTKKEVAWKFIEHIAFKHVDADSVGNLPGYLPFRKQNEANKPNEFLGGQNEQEVYKNSLEKTEEYSVTPLDKDAFSLWDQEVNDGLEEGLTASHIMQNISAQIENKFSKTIELLKEESKIGKEE